MAVTVWPVFFLFCVYQTVPWVSADNITCLLIPHWASYCVSCFIKKTPSEHWRCNFRLLWKLLKHLHSSSWSLKSLPAAAYDLLLCLQFGMYCAFCQTCCSPLLIVLWLCKSPLSDWVVESYKTLSTHMYFQYTSNKIKCLLVASEAGMEEFETRLRSMEKQSR